MQNLQYLEFPLNIWSILIIEWIEYRDLVYAEHGLRVVLKDTCFYSSFRHLSSVLLKSHVNVEEALWLRSRVGMFTKGYCSCMPYNQIGCLLAKYADHLNLVEFQQQTDNYSVLREFIELTQGSVSCTASYSGNCIVKYDCADRSLYLSEHYKGFLWEILKRLEGLRKICYHNDETYDASITAFDKFSETLESLEIWHGTVSEATLSPFQNLKELKMKHFHPTPYFPVASLSAFEFASCSYSDGVMTLGTRLNDTTIVNLLSLPKCSITDLTIKHTALGDVEVATEATP